MQEVVRKRKPRTLASRVAALEAEIAELKQKLQASADAAASSRPVKDWRRTVGRFKDDPTFDEAVRLGRAWRRRQPKC